MDNRFECLVAKRNSTVTTRKQRDYPWNTLGEFLVNDITPEGNLTTGDAAELNKLIQERLSEFLKAGVDTTYCSWKSATPNGGFHAMYILTMDKFANELIESVDFYKLCNKKFNDADYEFIGSEEYITKRQNCLVFDLGLPEYSLEICFMLRPFIFGGQGTNFDNLFHSGSMFVRTKGNSRGWFYQM